LQEFPLPEAYPLGVARLLDSLAQRLNVVCFAPSGDPAAVVRAVAESGETFLTPTVYAGTPALRVAFSNWRTDEADDDRIFEALRAALAKAAA
ncbi:hypothetical protein ACFQ0D_34000, partial [Micromonospora zhanjiangensis]